MTREKSEPGEHRSIRLFSPGTVAVVGFFEVLGLGLSILATVVWASVGAINWFALVMTAIVVLFSMGLLSMTWRGRRADERLGGVPDSLAGENVSFAVQPRLRGTFVALSFSVVAVVVVGAWVYIAGGSRIERTAPESQREDLANMLVMVALLACIAGFLAQQALWLWTNRRTRFLWIGSHGLGYLPSRVDDIGYLPWSSVASIEHQQITAAQSPRTLYHRFLIVTGAGTTSVVMTMGAVTMSVRGMLDVLNAVAPHVERIGLEVPAEGWGDAVPQRGHQ